MYNIDPFFIQEIAYKIRDEIINHQINAGATFESETIDIKVLADIYVGKILRTLYTEIDLKPIWDKMKAKGLLRNV